MSTDPRSLCAFRAAALFALLAQVAIASPTQEEPKIPRTLPHMEDVKLPAEAAPSVPLAVPERVVEDSARQRAPKPPKPPKPPQAGDATTPHTPIIDFSRIYFDQPGDGSTWARARTYKARFDEQGATYIPFLGSSAPRNFPVRVQLESARIGGTPVHLATHGVARTGDSITIERGSLSEVWHLRLDEAEQTFVLAARPAAAGPLELRIVFESELEPRATAQGIVLAGERGSVAISRAIAVDAAGARTQLETRLEAGRMAIDVPAWVMADAVYPLVVDPVYSTNSLESYTNATFLPDIANSGTTGNWTAVYQYSFSATDADVWMVDVYFGFPVAGSGFWVDSTSNSWLIPRVAYNALQNSYLTVCQVSAPATTPTEIWCRSRAAGTMNQQPQKLIQDGSLGSCYQPEVGGDPALTGPTYFLVAWTRTSSASDSDVHGRLVDWSGNVLGTSQIFIANSTAFDWKPRVSKTNGRPPFATQEWNIVWMRQTSTSDVWGAQIHWDGAVTTPAFPIDQSAGVDTSPCASSLLDGASGARPWMVAWERPIGGDSDILAQVMVGSTSVASVNVSILENADVFENQISPDVDTNGKRFVLAYSESYNGSSSDRDLYVATLHVEAGQIRVDEAHQNVDLSGLDTAGAQIAGGLTQSGTAFPYYGLVWTRYGMGTEDVYVGAYHEPDTVASFCAGDGSAGPCPCGNTGAGGHGCANSATTGGTLIPQGLAYVSADTFSLLSTQLPEGTSCLFFQGTNLATTGSAFGDGLRCLSGTIARLGTKAATNGTATYPGPGDLPIAVKGGLPAEGGTRGYQVWYRNSANFCTPATFNLTAGLRVLWLR